MKTPEDAKKELVRFITYKVAENAGMEHADLDQIVILANSCQNYLPKRFVGIIQDFDEDFDNSPHVQRAFLSRLERVLELSSTYPDQVTTDISDPLLPTFSLNESDRNRVVELCASMRKIVIASTDFDQPHRVRLLNRIAAIEKQVESPKGLFDVVLAGVSDVGETLGKFGKDIKPLTDRMKEVASIVRRNTDEYRQIPAPDEVKQLPAPDSDSKS